METEAGRYIDDDDYKQGLVDSKSYGVTSRRGRHKYSSYSTNPSLVDESCIQNFILVVYILKHFFVSYLLEQ